MLKAYKYCLLPDDEQKSSLDGLFRACRFVYNLALETKKRAWESAEIRLSAYELMKQLTELKHHECSWLKEYMAITLESEISHLDAAYKRFFKGAGFPKFKSRHSRQSAEFRKGVKVLNDEVYLPKIGNIQFIQHREIGIGDIRTCTVSKEESGKYFISILIRNDETAPKKAEKKSESAIGVDVGLKSFAIFSDGSKVDNPKYLTEQLKRLRVEQRRLARKFKKGQKEQSKGYLKQKMVVVKLHERIRNKRSDFLQKLTTDLIRANDTICVENLNISGMIKNSNLSKAISDVGWGEFVRMLKYKGEWYGKNIIQIGRFESSSKTCSSCGSKKENLTLDHRFWTCDNCGSYHDRDINAAINIKNIGLKAQPTTAKTGQKVESIGCESLPRKGEIALFTQ